MDAMTQFDSTLYPQTNPSNPILLAYRIGGKGRHPRLLATASDAQVSHAVEVLTRLASLSG